MRNHLFLTLAAAAAITAFPAATSAAPPVSATAPSRDTLLLSRLTAEHSRSKTAIKVETVIYADNYALSEWYNQDAGGVMLFNRNAAHQWHYIGGGGGIMTANDLVQAYHIPAATAAELARRLRLHNELHH